MNINKLLSPLLFIVIIVLAGCSKSDDPSISKQIDNSNTATSSSSFESNTEKLPNVEVVFNSEKEKDWYGDVYYTNKQGGRKLIARSKEDEDVREGRVPEDTIHYTSAALSPNQKFISMVYECWETSCLQVYVIDTGEIHEANQADFEVKWLGDNRLRIDGPCEIDRACGIFESVDSKQPWILEEIKK